MMSMNHRMENHGCYVNTLTGEMWDRLLCCPVCGYQLAVNLEPFERRVIRPGENDLTQEDAAKIQQLIKEYQPAAAQRILDGVPGHSFSTRPGLSFEAKAQKQGAP